ncbi:signal peptidase I [Anaerosalibacter sp. Marseille-P3206]|uniref:signal peptidase I n=1 Tax=Anaerosalibacter sp. Marseille-P3206 TaxID=1871005 RepID=UPI0009867479|nr:signal peptidase I [Anaerosalibacter sp. Marseille-P3206]
MEEDRKEKAKNEVVEWIKSIALAVVVAILIKTFIFNTTYVLGSSMYPTLFEKDRLFTNKVTLYFSEPNVGDIVVLKAPDNPNKDYIKRVIGLPGDTVEIIDGKVYLNGEVLDEYYLEEGAYTHTYDESKWVVPEDYVFVLGDNRGEGASKDSRYFGCIPISSIKGKANFRYFPFDSRFGVLK